MDKDSVTPVEGKGKPPIDIQSEASQIAADASTPDTAPKRKGRPRGSKNKTGSGAQSGDAYVSAQMVNGLFFSTCGTFGGQDMLPTAKEKKELDAYLTGYLETREKLPISPGMAVALVYASYVVGKLGQESVKEKVTLRTFKMAKWLKAKLTFTKKGKAKDVEPDDIDPPTGQMADSGRQRSGGGWLVGKAGIGREGVG